MKPRKPLRKVSKKRAADAKVYAKRKKVFLTFNFYCFVCANFTYPTDRELHHLRGRAGKLYLDERFWRMACGGPLGCHAKIHANPKWAIDHGYLAGKGEWNTSP